jgi:hypothetical protein
MSKGFDKAATSQLDSIKSAVATLFHAASYKPLMIPIVPSRNSLGLQKGQVKTWHGESIPDCTGFVFAVSCSSEEAKLLIDLLTNWQQQRESDRNG